MPIHRANEPRVSLIEFVRVFVGSGNRCNGSSWSLSPLRADPPALSEAATEIVAEYVDEVIIEADLTQDRPRSRRVPSSRLRLIPQDALP